MAEIPGSPASHNIITPQCRLNRTNKGAFDEAVDRARRVYDQICDGWSEVVPQPTLHLVLTMERP